ncbi:MAG TPA: hypothetical protein VL442_12095 [Mucilaginibacter sp.]|nr:hypothetical protein [Mucilaginibacter sp.]
MQGIKYTVKIWLSGLLFTPVIYILLLTIFSEFHFPTTIGSVVIPYVVPYSFLMSVWVALGIFATIQLSPNSVFIKRTLIIASFLMPFAAMLMINSINALQNYGSGYLLALAYAISTALFIWLYPVSSSNIKASRSVLQSIKNSIIYGLTVWLFTFLFSTLVSILIWMVTKDFKSASAVKTAQNILERYNFQFSLSIAYFITVALTTLIVINLDISENKKKAIILLFAFPICFPVLFYYQLFSGEIFVHDSTELFKLTSPSIMVSALSIWLIDIIPGAKTKD